MARRCRYPRIAKIGSISQVSAREVSESVAHCYALYPCYLGKEAINAETQLKMALYCTQGSGTLCQQLLMMHGIAWYCMVLHCIA